MKTIKLLLITFCAMLSSCTGDVIFSEQTKIENCTWDMNNPVVFDVSTDDIDTICCYDLQVTMRHDETYPNQNIWLFVESQNETGFTSRDTLQCFLVDNYGHWIGSGVGTLHYISVYYKENYRFPHKGSWRYTIRHGMRDSQLKGIVNVGLRIERHKNK